MQLTLLFGLATSLLFSSASSMAIEARESPDTCGSGANYYLCKCVNPNGDVDDLPATQNACTEESKRGNHKMEGAWCRNDYTKVPGLHTINNCKFEKECQKTNGQLRQVCSGKE